MKRTYKKFLANIFNAESLNFSPKIENNKGYFFIPFLLNSKLEILVIAIRQNKK